MPPKAPANVRFSPCREVAPSRCGHRLIHHLLLHAAWYDPGKQCPGREHVQTRLRDEKEATEFKANPQEQ